MRHHLLANTRMTPVERSMGRFMRAPEHPAGDDSGGSGGGTQADSGQGGNNPTGNSGDSNANGNGNGNNDGQGFDAEAFWKEPSEASSGSGNNGQTPTPPAPPADQGQNLGKTIGETIAALKFEPAFTTEIAEEINNGNLEGANARIESIGREAVRQAVTQTVPIIQQFGTKLLERVEQMIESRFGTQENNQTLLESFPSAKDPAVRPMIEGVFGQAMKHTKGDRTKAIAMTRDMLKFMGKTASSDFGIETPPNQPGDFMNPRSSSLVDELLGRG